MGSRHDYSTKVMISAFMAKFRVWLIAVDREICSRKVMDFLFRSPDSAFWKAISASNAKQNICWFLVRKKEIQDMAARFALQTFVMAFIILLPCMDIDTRVSRTLPVRTINMTNKIWI